MNYSSPFPVTGKHSNLMASEPDPTYRWVGFKARVFFTKEYKGNMLKNAVEEVQSPAMD